MVSHMTSVHRLEGAKQGSNSDFSDCKSLSVLNMQSNGSQTLACKRITWR